MELILKLNRWANEHTNIAIDVIRVVFGLFIFYKGIYFMNDTQYLYDLLQPVTASGSLALVHYVALANLCGGFFIAIGLLTRLCALVQLPILLGAALINFAGVMDLANLVEASAALGFCVCFLFFGSGKHSVDYKLQLHV